MNYEKLSQIAEAEVRRTLRSFPREIRDRVQSVPVFFERRPDADDLAQGVEPDTLGFYDEGPSEAATPRIRLWLENLWDLAEGDEAAFLDEVHITLLHEIGHFLGWDEEDLAERDLD